jgi:superfamily II DNA/RNA helicase
MVDIGFQERIGEILKHCPPKRSPEEPNGRQTLMFSATFPADIRILSAALLNEEHIFISVGRSCSSIDLITQQFQYLDRSEKSAALFALLEEVPGKTLGTYWFRSLFVCLLFTFELFVVVFSFHFSSSSLPSLCPDEEHVRHDREGPAACGHPVHGNARRQVAIGT